MAENPAAISNAASSILLRPEDEEDLEERFVADMTLRFKPLKKLFKKQDKHLWRASEVDLADDWKDWATKLTKQQRRFFELVFSFFAGADGLVGYNIISRLEGSVKPFEAQLFYGVQRHIENVHAMFYTRLIKELAARHKPKKIARLLRSFRNDISVKAKMDFYRSLLAPEKTFGETLIGALLLEGLGFSVAFLFIFYAKYLKVLPGVVEGNKFIARDENFHCQFAVEIFKLLQPSERPASESIRDLFKRAVATEDAFIDAALPARLVGINADTSKSYVRYVANHWLNELGLEPLYAPEEAKTVSWMADQGILVRPNFFETRNTNYSTADSDSDDSDSESGSAESEDDSEDE